MKVSTFLYGAFANGGKMWGGNIGEDPIASVEASIENGGVTTIDTAPA